MEKKKIKPHTECKDANEFWSQYYGREVSDNEVEQIRRNVKRLYDVLVEIKKGEKK